MATPVYWGELLSSIRLAMTSQNSIELFCEQWRRRFGAKYCFVTSSGRASLYLVLKAMRRLRTRTEVIIPAFICPSVAVSVAKAGLKIIPVEVSRDGFGIDPEALKKAVSSETLAVVAAHMFGYPAANLGQILEISHTAGAFTIEDAAQSAGAEYEGKAAGTLGDAGIFSLGMSKALSTMGGGVIVTQMPELAQALAELTRALDQCSPLHFVMTAGKISIYNIITRSRHLGLLILMWERYFRGRDDLQDFVIRSYSPLQAGLGLLLLKRIDRINRERSRHASELTEKLRNVVGISLPSETGRPIYLRYPVLIHDSAKQRKVLKLVRSLGINAYEPYAREEYEAVLKMAARPGRYPVTEYIIDHLLVLPTHFSVTQHEIGIIAGAFREVCGPAFSFS